ncbi:MAG: hypothetical protein ACK5JL_07405 [Candidatus Kapaibacterium sp.]|jgi:hypothetical protein
MIRNFYSVSDEHIAIMTEAQYWRWYHGELTDKDMDTISISGPLVHNGKQLSVEVSLADAFGIEEWAGVWWKTPVFGWAGR